MNPKLKMAFAVIAIVILVSAVVLLTRSREGAPQQPPTEPPVTIEPAETAEEPEAVVPPVPMESTTAEVEVPEIPLPEGGVDTLIPLPQQNTPPPESEVAEFLEAMKEKLGWNKIKTMKCKMTMEMTVPTPKGPMAMKTAGELTVEMPKKMNNVFEIEANGQIMRMYQVTDGVFMEMGTISADGKRSPMQMKNFDPSENGMALFGGGMAESSQSGELKKVTVDPADPAFQKEDGSPLDNLELTVLTSGTKDLSIETYVDPVTMEMKAIKMYKADVLAGWGSHVKYQDIGDGIMYPVGYDFTMNPAAMGAPASVGGNMTMKLGISDIDLNPELDPGIFNFTMTPQPSP